MALTATLASSPNGAVHPPTFSFGATSPVSITGTAAGTATLAVNTTPISGCTQAHQTSASARWYAGGGAILGALLGCVPIRRCRWRGLLALGFLLLALYGGALSCGGGSSCVALRATTPGAYAIKVSGASSTGDIIGTINLTVQ